MDSFIVIIVIGLSVTLMFVFPLMTMSDRTDDMSQLALKTAITEFVDNVRTSGKLTAENYDKLIQTINATGNTYDVEMEGKFLDENPSKKTTITTTVKIGENVYYSKYTSQLLEELDKTGSISFKEGDYFAVSVKNTNTTLSQQLKNFFYTVSGNDTYTLSAQHGGMVTANGSK